MKKINKVSRRRFFQWGAGVAGTLASARGVASVCGGSTGGQPLGPFFPNDGTPSEPTIEEPQPGQAIALANDNDLTQLKGVPGKAKGQVVHILGTVTDSHCQPVSGASVIIWQASSSGRYNHMGDSANEDFIHPQTGEVVHREIDKKFQYWGKSTTDSLGQYSFKTIVPGFYPASLSQGWYRPPHVHFLISATGFPQMVTQMYFRGDEIENDQWNQELNNRDALLQSNGLTDQQREDLIVDFVRSDESIFHGALVGQFDIILNSST